MSIAKNKALACVLMLALTTTAIIVKRKYFPSLKEADFSINVRSLQEAGSGLAVVRPTQFAWSHFNGTISTTVSVHGKPVERFMGRDVSFKDLMAMAYGQNAGRVVLPVNAPNTNFDFLITVLTNQMPCLQGAIRRQLGFIAHMELHETGVLALKVEDARLPGLTLNRTDQSEKNEFKNGRLWITHMRLDTMPEHLERLIGTTVVDKTGLTNFYDFSLAWDVQVQQQLQKSSTARDVVDKMLKELGLALKPDTAIFEMLVVKKAE